MPPTRPAKYRHVATLQTKTIVKDPIGGTVESWTDGSRFHCQVVSEPRPGNRFSGTGQTQVVDVRTWFVTRKGSLVFTRTLRIKHHNRQYEILDVQDTLGEDKEISLVCREVIP